MAAIARAADVATADVKIDKIEEVCASLCARAESGLVGMHIRQLTRRLPSPDSGSPEEAAGEKHPRRDEHQGRRPERCYYYGQQAHGQQVSILSFDVHA